MAVGVKTTKSQVTLCYCILEQAGNDTFFFLNATVGAMEIESVQNAHISHLQV